MNLVHTSPTEITAINTDGRFGSFLCFAAQEYATTAGAHVTYRIDIDERDIIRAGSLFYHSDAATLEPLVERVAGMVGCDEDTAEDLIAQNIDVHELDLDIDPEDRANMSWDIQHVTGQAAKLLGYRGASMEDEQGTCYLIDMLGREAELVRRHD